MQIRRHASFKAGLEAAFPLGSVHTRLHAHAKPTLNLHGIVSELETQPAFDLHFPTFQDAEILTPSGLLVKTNPWETLARRCMVVHAVCV